MNYLLSAIWVFVYFGLSAQITFTSVPQNNQLVGRDLVTNLGTVKFTGAMDLSTLSYDELRFDEYRDNVLHSSQTIALVPGGMTNFDIAFLIQAELANYSYIVSGVTANTLTTLHTIDKIVAGDSYLIVGQSNAEARSYDGSSAPAQRDFIRVYASGIPLEANLIANDTWYLGQGDGSRFTNGNTGQWGLRMASQIVNELQIPIAIFNAGHGGKDIAFFQAPADYQTSLASNYGRTYYRINQTGLNEHIRAVIWSQGERDALPGIATSTEAYKAAFSNLTASWLTDYPNIEQFYIFQSKNGCARPTENMMRIKEAQRQLAKSSPMIHTIQTAALNSFNDNCHFTYENGYKTFGDRLYSLMRTDIYGKKSLTENETPMIELIELINPTTIQITTASNNLHLSGTVTDFELVNAYGANIESICTHRGNIFLHLSQFPGHESALSYIAPEEAELGFFIMNSQGLELICFNQVPVRTTHASTDATASLHDHSYSIGVFPNPASSQVQIAMHGNPLANELIQIYTESGAHMMDQRTDGNGMLGISDLSSGMYLLRLHGAQIPVQLLVE